MASLRHRDTTIASRHAWSNACPGSCGEFDVLDDFELFALRDAVGSWPQQDEAMAQLYRAFGAEQEKRGRPWLKAKLSEEEAR